MTDGLVRVQADDLRARRIGGRMTADEVELELPLTLCEHRPKDDLERCAAFEFGRCLLDREQIGEGILTPIAGAVLLPHQSPLLQVAQVILGDRGIEIANVAEPVWTAGRLRKRRH